MPEYGTIVYLYLNGLRIKRFLLQAGIIYVINYYK
jgi:hypothetical protein